MTNLYLVRVSAAMAVAACLTGCGTPQTVPMAPNYSSSAATPPMYGVPAAPSHNVAPATVDGKVVPSYGSNYNPANGTTNGK